MFLVELIAFPFLDLISKQARPGCRCMRVVVVVVVVVFFFLTLPYPVPVPKNCVIFIGCNFESRASQVGLHKQKKAVGVGFLIYSQKASMSRIYYFRNRSSPGRFVA